MWEIATVGKLTLDDNSNQNTQITLQGSRKVRIRSFSILRHYAGDIIIQQNELTGDS